MKKEDILTIVVVSILIIITVFGFSYGLTKERKEKVNSISIYNDSIKLKREKQLKVYQDSIYKANIWRIQDIKDQYNAGRMSVYNFKQLASCNVSYLYWSEYEYNYILLLLRNSNKLEHSKVFSNRDVIETYTFYKGNYKFKLYQKLN